MADLTLYLNVSAARDSLILEGQLQILIIRKQTHALVLTWLDTSYIHSSQVQYWRKCTNTIEMRKESLGITKGQQVLGSTSAGSANVHVKLSPRSLLPKILVVKCDLKLFSPGCGPNF